MRHYAHESCHEIRAYSRVEKRGGGDMSREATFRIHLNIVKRSPLVAENVVVLKVGFFPVL